MPTFTKITKVGAFTDDVAAQINKNFAQLGTVLSLSGIDPQKSLEKLHEQQAQAHAQQPDEPVPDPSKPWYTDPPPPQEQPPAPQAEPTPPDNAEHKDPEPKSRSKNK